MNSLDQLHLLLSKLKNSIRIWYLITGLCYIVVATALVFFLNLFLDRVFLFDWIQRLICLVLGCFYLAYIFYKNLISPLLTSISDEYLCLAIEKRRPELGQIISSGYQFANMDQPEVYGYSKRLVDATIDQCIQATATVNIKELINNKFKSKLFVCGSFSALLFGLFVYNFPSEFSIWLERNVYLQNTKWPRKTILKIEDIKIGNKIYVPEGDSYDLLIRADSSGYIPSIVKIKIFKDQYYSYANANLVGANEYNYRFDKINKNLSFVVYGGDDESDLIQIITIKKPEIQSVKFICIPPDYTGLPEYTLDENQSSWLVLENSKISISGVSSKNLTRVEILYNNTELIIKNSKLNAKLFSAVMESDQVKSGTYEINVFDEDNITKKPGSSFSLVVSGDKLPEINTKWRYHSEFITLNAQAPCLWNAKDDYGLAKVGLHLFSVNKDESNNEVASENLFVHNTEVEKEKSGSYKLSLSNYSLKVGQHLLLYLEVNDFLVRNTVSFSRSNVTRFAVVSEEDFEKYILSKEQALIVEVEKTIKEMEDCQISTASIMDGLKKTNDMDSNHIRELNIIEKKQKFIEQKNATIVSRFAYIINDLEVNQIKDENDANKLRIKNKIMNPLSEINQSLIPVAMQYALSARINADKNGKIKALGDLFKSQANIIVEYNKILKDMKKWEGYYETVGMLKEIIKEQKNLIDKTENNKKENIKGVFDE